MKQSQILKTIVRRKNVYWNFEKNKKIENFELHDFTIGKKENFEISAITFSENNIFHNWRLFPISNIRKNYHF